MKRAFVVHFVYVCALAIAVTMVTSANGLGALRLARDGGTSIANAPQLQVGTQVTGGSSATGSYCESAPCEFWRLNLAQGDRVTMDYGSLDDGGIILMVLTPDVTDYTLNQVSPKYFSEALLGSKREFVWYATKAGNWSFAISGHYELTARVAHMISATLDPSALAFIRSAKATSLPRTGQLAVNVTSPAGPIATGAVGGELDGYWSKAWHKLAVANVKGGKITLPYRLPRTVSGAVRLNLNVGGGTYQGKHILVRGLHVAPQH